MIESKNVWRFLSLINNKALNTRINWCYCEIEDKIETKTSTTWTGNTVAHRGHILVLSRDIWHLTAWYSVVT